MRVADELWEASEEEFPFDAPRRDQLRFLLNFAVLAPSIYNTQPWFFRISGDALELYADRTRLLKGFDPSGRELVLSCGASLMYLRVAMRYHGVEPVVKTFPQMDVQNLLASIRLGAAHEPDDEDRMLFASIRRRGHAGYTRSAADPRERLMAAVLREGALMDVIQDERRGALARLIEEGIRLQTVNPEYRHDLAAWTPIVTDKRNAWADEDARMAGDGVSEDGAMLVHNVNWGEGTSRSKKTAAESEPILAVVSTRSENPFEWLAAGQALGRLLLVARDLDLHASFLNQPVEVQTLREQLRHLVGADRTPQIVLRLAQGDQAIPAPRRPLHDILSAF